MTKKIGKILPLLIFLGAFMIYMFTLAPTVVWGDSADLALKVFDFTLDPAADGHPLFIVLGRFFNSFLISELAVNLNIMSAFFAALAVVFVFLSVRKITGSNLPALAGAVALTVSHSFWFYAVITEVYTLNAFFLAFLIWLMLLWREKPENVSLLYLGAFIFGLSITNHMLIGLFGIAILFTIATHQPKIFQDWKKIGLILLLFGLGSSLYWGTILYWSFVLPPSKTADVIDIVTGRAEHRASMLAFKALGKNLFLYLAYLFYQFPFWGFLLGFAGFHSMYKKDNRLFGFLFLALFPNALFTMAGAGTYGNANFTFYISDYVVFSIAIGYGLDKFLWFMRNTRWVIPRPEEYTQRFMPGMLVIILLYITPVAMYNIVPKLVERFDIDLIYGRPLPYRNNNLYFLNPNKRGYAGAEHYAKVALRRSKRWTSIIIADFTPGTVLEYFTRVMGLRSDVLVVYTTDVGKPPDYDLLPFVDKNIGRWTIYLADLMYNYNVDNVLKKYNIKKSNPMWSIEPIEISP